MTDRNIEIEGKWLVGPGFHPYQLQGLPDTAIRQGYIAIDPNGNNVRVRDADGIYTMTVKGKADGGLKTEVERAIDEDYFSELWPLTEGRRIEKTRVLNPLIGRHAIYGTSEIDIFHVEHHGLIIVEVEVASRAMLEALRSDPPAWFGRDVTDDPRYSNAWLAQNGMPPKD